MIRIASAFLALVFPALANASDSVDSLQSYRHLGGAAFSKYHSLIFETLGPHGVYSVTPSDYKPKRIDCFTPYADGPAVPDGALPASEHFPWVVKKARNYLLNSPERQFIAVRPDGSDCKHLDLSDEDRLMMVPRTDFLAKVSGKVFSLLDLRTLHEIELFRATEIQTFALKSSPDGKFLVVSYAKGGEAEKCVEHRLYEMPSLRMLGKSELKTEDYESGNPYPACRASNPVFIGKNLYLHAKGYMGSYANR
ncbi:MAG: hypothetical protein NTV34_12170, partial [Proteobacteria bacterium]|nr:hypothetical protein [Pseudomonadota bacterium]